MKKHLFYAALLATTFLAGNALADCQEGYILGEGMEYDYEDHVAPTSRCIPISGSCGTNCNYEYKGDTLYVYGPEDGKEGIFGTYGPEYKNNAEMYDNTIFGSGDGEAGIIVPSNVTNLVISGNITMIGDYAFAHNQSIKNVILPDTLKILGNCAFCSSGISGDINLPDSLEYLGFAPFGSTDVTSIAIPDSLMFSEEDIEWYQESGKPFDGVLEIFCSETRKEKPHCGIPDGAFYDVNNISFGYYKDENGFRTFYNADGTLADREAEPLASKNNADSALIEKYHGTPLLYGQKIYTVQEAEEALKDGTKFHVGLTYK